MRKIKIWAVLIGVGLCLGGCGSGEVVRTMGKCAPGEVEIEGYGDKGKKLANCFVEYPGEPTREDKSYYIVEDVCGQFTKEFVEDRLGRPVTRIKGPELDSLFNCSYYLGEEDEYVMLVLEYLSAENQRKGQEMMGRKVAKNPAIAMENMVVTQEDGEVNTIYLILGENKFISIKRSNKAELNGDELINFAARLADEIKNYK